MIFPGLNETDKLKIDTVDTKRGSIYDRNGKLLAGEGKVSSVGLVPGKMNQDHEADIEALSKLLGISADSIKQSLSASYVKENTFVKLANISQTDSKTETELMRIAGIQIKTSEGRIYPYGEDASHLVGYVREITQEELKENVGKGYNSSSLIGKVGLEKAFEEKLRGLAGYEVYLVDAKGNKKKTIINRQVKNGEDVKLTIDINIQKIINAQYKNDESATIVMNPKTGEILAMSSTPLYNSNDFILGMTDEKWQTITSDQREPLFNRYQSAWVPGSSFKPVIGAIALSENIISAEEDFGTSGKKWQKDSSWGPYHVTTVKTYEGPANLRNGLVYSDNIYFAKLALKIGKNKLKNNLNKLKFNETIDFPMTMTTSKYASDDNFESEVQLADTGYGQGKVLVNQIHMASIYSAFVNDGNMVKPYIEYQGENVAPTYYVEKAFSKEAAKTITEDLIQVIEDEEGTGHLAKIEGVTLAGKTGTAEIKKTQEDTEGTEIGWFNVFVADENYQTQVLIVSMVEDVHAKTQKGYVTSSVKAILKKIL